MPKISKTTKPTWNCSSTVSTAMSSASSTTWSKRSAGSTYRSARFVKTVRVITFKDVNVEELAKTDDIALPKDGSLGA